MAKDITDKFKYRASTVVTTKDGQIEVSTVNLRDPDFKEGRYETMVFRLKDGKRPPIQDILFEDHRYGKDNACKMHRDACKRYDHEGAEYLFVRPGVYERSNATQ